MITYMLTDVMITYRLTDVMIAMAANKNFKWTYLIVKWAYWIVIITANGSATDLKEKDEDSKSRESEEERKREIEERLRNYDTVEVVEHRAVDNERHEAETHAHEDHAGHDDRDDHDGVDHREKEEDVVLSHYHEERFDYRERDEDEPKTDSYDYNNKVRYSYNRNDYTI